jgi:uncharacterized repeat protein (TIGR03803 family)
VFKIDNAGNYSVLWSFGSIAGVADGKWPTAGVIMDGSGNLFGTTSKGGRFNGGTIFQIIPEGEQEFVVYDFGGPGDGQWPLGGLAMDANGTVTARRQREVPSTREPCSGSTTPGICCCTASTGTTERLQPLV